MCYMLKNSKMTEGSVKIDRENNGAQKDINVDSVW